jgi:DNA gyrase/topoisomerase IV subunit A
MTTTYAQPITRRSTRSKQVVPALWRQVVRGAVKRDEQAVQAEPDRSAFTQLEIYEGVLSAFDRRAEVLDAIAASPDRATSVRRIRELLDVTHLQATAILDLPLQRFTTESRDRIAHRATELRSALTR